MAFKDKYWKTGVEDFLAYKGKKYNGEYPTFREVIEITEERYPDNEAFKAIVPEKLTFTYREALKKIKEADANASVIMCSAMGQQAMVIESIQSGAKDFIVKPFQADRVLEAVKKAIG